MHFPKIEQIAASDQILVFFENKLMVQGDRFIWAFSELERFLPDGSDVVLIDTLDGVRYAAVRIYHDLSDILQTEHKSLRSLLFNNAGIEIALAGKATQLLDWYVSHQYCGRCGNATQHHESQRVLVCHSCREQYFPRINPCAIMLVTRGKEVLLARSARFRSGFYSCLAGFIEVGETPEETVVREVKEEVGIEVDNIRYIKSQSWPFPSQLMLGFIADYKSGDIVPEPEEIEEAGWYSVDALPNVPAAGISVAGELIQHYVDSYKSA